MAQSTLPFPASRRAHPAQKTHWILYKTLLLDSLVAFAYPQGSTLNLFENS
jgi:hypothetical protein